MRAAVGIVISVLLAATAYEALVAFGVIELGSLPGEGPPGEQTIALVAILTMLVAAGLALFAALGVRVPLVVLLAPGSAVFLVARFYTFDPYYLPTLRRFSEDGMLRPVLVYCMLALALGAALSTCANQRVGAVLSVPVILACALFAQVLVGGH